MLEEGRSDAEATVGSEDAERHDVDAHGILVDRFETATDGSDGNIVEEAQLADLGSIGIEDVLVEALRVLDGKEDAVELAELAEVVGRQLRHVDALGKERAHGRSRPSVVAHRRKRPGRGGGSSSGHARVETGAALNGRLEDCS